MSQRSAGSWCRARGCASARAVERPARRHRAHPHTGDALRPPRPRGSLAAGLPGAGGQARAGDRLHRHERPDHRAAPALRGPHRGAVPGPAPLPAPLAARGPVGRGSVLGSGPPGSHEPPRCPFSNARPGRVAATPPWRNEVLVILFGNQVVKGGAEMSGSVRGVVGAANLNDGAPSDEDLAPRAGEPVATNRASA